jgi:hypothetical protein
MSDETSILATSANEQQQPACERCGSLAAARFGDVVICDECYVACAACCADAEEK